MNKSFGILILGAALTAGVAFAAGHDKGDKGGDRGARRAAWLATELDLTEEQQASFKAMRELHQSEMKPLRDEGRALHERLRAAMEAEHPDPQAVGEATIAMKQHRQAVEAAQKAFHEKLSAQLTPEQKAKFDSLSERQRMHRGPEGSRGRGPGRRPAPESEAKAGPKS